MVVRLLALYSVGVAWLLALALSSFYRAADRGLKLLDSGRIEEGMAIYAGACRTNPDFRGKAELGIGSALLRLGKSKEAIGHLELAVADEPRLGAAYFNLGQALIMQGQYEGSAAAFGKAAALDPGDAEAEADLGVALARMGKLREAIAHLRAALRIDPSLEQARANLRALELAWKPGLRR